MELSKFVTSLENLFLRHNNVLLLSFPPRSPLFSAFTLFQLVAVGLATFLAAGLLSALAFSYCHHLNRPSAESAVIHPSTPNHLTYNKHGNAMPKNEKYIPMEFKVAQSHNLCLSIEGRNISQRINVL